MFEHASYSFPSWLLLPLELLLVALAGGLLAIWLRHGERSPHDTSPWRPISSPAVVALPALVALALQSTSFAILGAPIARFGDEHAYLLQSETFAAGRFTNPPLEPQEAFGCPHVVPTPTRQSKYPPGQGTLLALGELLGHPAAGVALSIALFAASTSWMLLAFVGRQWALVGGLFVAFRFGLGSYWGQSYWGGSLAATGGLLLVGGLTRLGRADRQWQSALLAGLGAGLLLATRPFEGLFVGLAALAWSLTARAPRRRPSVGELALAALPLAAIVGVVLAYHQAVTGSPWTLPHRLYSATVIAQPHFAWEVDAGLFTGVVGPALRKAALTIYFQLGFVLLVPLTIVALWRGGTGSTDTTTRDDLRDGVGLGALVVAATLLAHALVLPYHPHYAAPGSAGFLLVCFVALHRLARRLSQGGGLRESTVGFAVLVVAAILALVQLPAQRPDAGSDALRRVEIGAQLEATPGRHLVLAEPGDFWSCNSADGVDSAILWARPRSPADDAALRARFPERRVWVVSRDADGVARLDPADDS
ncbi:MAG: hypothetical protein AAGC60_09620 [Acidobacteriota bacterium]